MSSFNRYIPSDLLSKRKYPKFSFEKMPRTLDTAMFKREFFTGAEVSSDVPVMGWIIDLPRAAHPDERFWLETHGFLFFGRAHRWLGGEWKRADQPDDFV